MAFSPRAAQLMHELNKIIAQTETQIAAIADELKKGPNTDPHAIRMVANDLGITTRNFFTFAALVQQGPDVPVETSAVPTYPNNIPWHSLVYKVRQTTSALNQWPTLQTLINAHLDFEPGTLYPMLPEGCGAIDQQQRALDQVFDVFHAMINPNKQDQNANEQGAFADIPLTQSIFIKHVQAACRVTRVQNLDRPARFIDVGCGGGLKVLTAAQYFSPCDGLDLDPGYVQAAQTFMQKANQPTSTIYEANALTFDQYDQYDVIYFFRPIKDEDLLRQLEERIATTARRHCILIVPYLVPSSRFEDLGCAKIAGSLYLTHATEEEAEALRISAETVGPYPPDAELRVEAIWHPIESALRNMGID